MTSISRTSVTKVGSDTQMAFAMSTCPSSVFRKGMCRVHLNDMGDDDSDDADADDRAIIACRIMVATSGPSLGLGPQLATGIAVCASAHSGIVAMPGGTLHFAPRGRLINGGAVASYRNTRGM